MQYSRIEEEARVQEMILKKAGEAAEACVYEVGDTVVKGYRAVEHAAVGGYKKIEDIAVSGYARIEDAFVETFLTKEGETAAEAKERLREEQAARAAGSSAKQEAAKQ